MRLRARRELLGLSQQTVAARIGTNQTRVSQLERGKWKAPDAVYVRLAECYGVPLSHFLPRAVDA
jgi:transcriptional regulator with XRE-family HTH domain